METGEKNLILMEIIASFFAQRWFNISVLAKHWAVKRSSPLFSCFDVSFIPCTQILVHVGFLTEESGDVFSPKVLKGGPLGEMVQWADIVTALHLLGHDLKISVSLKELHGYVNARKASLFVHILRGFLRAPVRDHLTICFGLLVEGKCSASDQQPSRSADAHMLFSVTFGQTQISYLSCLQSAVSAWGLDSISFLPLLTDSSDSRLVAHHTQVLIPEDNTHTHTQIKIQYHTVPPSQTDKLVSSKNIRLLIVKWVWGAVGGVLAGPVLPWAFSRCRDLSELLWLHASWSGKWLRARLDLLSILLCQWVVWSRSRQADDNVSLLLANACDAVGTRWEHWWAGAALWSYISAVGEKLLW